MLPLGGIAGFSPATILRRVDLVDVPRGSGATPKPDEEVEMHKTKSVPLDLIPLLRQTSSEGLARLITWCQCYVQRWHGLSAEDGEDIAQEALMETLAESQPDDSDQELGEALMRALERVKKRRQREIPRFLMDGTTAYELVSNAEQETNLISTELYRRVQTVLFQALETGIPQLSDRAHDLVTRIYGLEKLFPPRRPEPEFPSAEAARKASWRARKALGDRLAESFRARIARGLSEVELLIVQICLEIVTEGDPETLADLFADE